MREKLNILKNFIMKYHGNPFKTERNFEKKRNNEEKRINEHKPEICECLSVLKYHLQVFYLRYLSVPPNGCK